MPNRLRLTSVGLPALAVLLMAGGEPGPSSAAAGAHDGTDYPRVAGRMIVEGPAIYGEVLTRREVSAGGVRTALIYPGGGRRDPVSGEVAAVAVSGVEVRCDARRFRYRYHEGYGEDGARVYRFDIPEDLPWNTGDRYSDLITALCSDPAVADQPRFTSVANFLELAGPAPVGAPAVVQPTE